eukprot:UN06485
MPPFIIMHFSYIRKLNFLIFQKTHKYVLSTFSLILT